MLGQRRLSVWDYCILFPPQHCLWLYSITSRLPGFARVPSLPPALPPALPHSDTFKNFIINVFFDLDTPHLASTLAVFIARVFPHSVTSSNVETFKNYRQHYVIARHVGGLLGDVWGREWGREALMRGRDGREGGWEEGWEGGREGREGGREEKEEWTRVKHLELLGITLAWRHRTSSYVISRKIFIIQPPNPPPWDGSIFFRWASPEGVQTDKGTLQFYIVDTEAITLPRET